MASAGFSAPVNYWGTISGLTPKSSPDGKTSSVAEAPNEYGDSAAADVYGEVLAPSVEYAVTGEIAATGDYVFPALGSIVTWNSTKKLMVTNITINTGANTPPTVTISGVEVESGATAKRIYYVRAAVSPRSKAQDVVGAFTEDTKFTQINTTFSVDPHVQTVAGVPVASDASHGKIEVAATMTDPTGSGTITAAGSGYVISAAAAESDPDAGYRTLTATATKFLGGTETSSLTQSSSSS